MVSNAFRLGSVLTPGKTTLGSSSLPTNIANAGFSIVQSTSDLPSSANTGAQSFVRDTKMLYLYNGSNWYKIAAVNQSPSSITGVNASYTLATDGTATTITAVATDPEGFPLTWSSTVSAGSLNGTTVSQVDNVFTITPHASNATTFSITFNVTDGANSSVSAISAFTLSFTPPLPTSGLTGLYDMNDTNSYSGSGTSWNDVSGNSGPTFTLDLSYATYIASSIGSIPSLALDTVTSNRVVYTDNSGLTNSSSPYANTVILIFAQQHSYYYTASDSQTYYYMMAKYPQPGTGTQGGSYAFMAETGSSSASILTDANSGHYAHWQNTSGTRGASSPGSKLYIDKVEATAYTRDQVFTAISGGTNAGKYHSIALTDGLFAYGFAMSFIHPNLSNATPLGNLRAMIFYNRALSSSEIDDVHDHFAGDYTSSEMVQ